MFETETMADLLWQQGHGAEAIALCRRLIGRARGDERTRLGAKAATWQEELPASTKRRSGNADGLVRGAGLTSHAQSQGEARVDEGELPSPAETSSIALALTPAGLSLVWSLPPRPEAPVAELFVVRRKRAEGILDVQRRTLPLGAFAGTLELPVADLHSARAAAGFLETNQFRPLARSALLKVEGLAPRDDGPRR